MTNLDKQMGGFVKQAVYSGVGLVAKGAEKAQTLLDELKKQDAANQENGKKIVEGFINKSGDAKKEWENRLKRIGGKLVSTFGYEEAEVVELKDKIERLEAVSAAEAGLASEGVHTTK